MFDHWNAFQDDHSIRQLAEDWATDPHVDWTDTDNQLLLMSEHEPDKALSVFCAIIQLTEDEETTGLLAAGHLENWLSGNGETMFETIRSLAQAHDDFRYLLSGVWQNNMPKVLFQKIRAIGVGRL